MEPSPQAKSLPIFILIAILVLLIPASFYLGTVYATGRESAEVTGASDLAEASTSTKTLRLSFVGYADDGQQSSSTVFLPSGTKITVASDAGVPMDNKFDVTPYESDNALYAKGSDGVYYDGVKIPGIDPATFKIIFPGGFSYDCATSAYIEDKNGIYTRGMYGDLGFEKIEGADPATFKVFLSGGFSRDKDYLYEGPVRTNLDPNDPQNSDSHCG